MTGRLPFTLTPLDGEPFGIWLHAYAARLDMSAAQLAVVIGMPGSDVQAATRPSPAQLAAACSATGLAPPAVTTMLACGRSPAPHLVRAWMPQRTTRFCPACLTAAPGQMIPARRLPVSFFCRRHRQALASGCPDCGSQPAALSTPAGTGHCDACGSPLGTASAPGCTDVPAACQAQEAIDSLLAGLRDHGETAASRRQALSQLTDITLTAFHLAAGGITRTPPQFTPGMLNASTLPAAFQLLLAQPGAQGHDQLASLARQVLPGTAPAAVPESWHDASPALRTRIARARDPWLAPVSRLRHATTLTEPRAPAARPPRAPDPAVTRAARLPDQIWADWAIRLADDNGARHDRFRPAALAALLIPHSDMPLKEITALASRQLKRHIANYHLAKFTTSPAALRILTELALAIDARDIPVHYQRRRDLAAGATLIDKATWAVMTRDAGMRATRLGHARRYLYELLTGCSLRTAPPPYQVTSAAMQASYHNFAIGMPADLASALHGHASHLLGSNGISDEPLEWQPPPGWVTATTWPGADPASTDPAPVHHALLHENASPAQAAANLGISIDHLRQVLRYHPLPRPLNPLRRTLIPRPAPGTPPPGQQPGVLYLDPAWLREEYLTWHRSLNDIARQLGCPVHILNTFAHQHGIPVRSRGSSMVITRATAPGRHPGDLPEPLRHALTGRHAPQRLHRLLAIAGHPSIPDAAQALGIRSSTLYAQLARLAKACGGPLRHPHPRDQGTLTPLGWQLCQQARDYLSLQPTPG